MIPNCIPNLAGRERDYVLEALDRNDLAVGPFIERFETAMRDTTGAPHAVAVASGTAALHLALLAAGVAPDDEVLVPAFAFAATANAVRYCGAWPLFTDCEGASWGMDPAQVEEFLSSDCERRGEALVNRNSGRRVTAMAPVHLYGHPADLDPLVGIAERYGLALVEDGAEALGATYKGRRLGALHRICVLSFNGNKVITAGGGGMILAADEEVAARCRYLANQAKGDSLDFIHDSVGFNYRMPNLNAALALGQAENLEKFVARKRAIAAAYTTRLADVPGVSVRASAPWAESSQWMAILRLDAGRYPGGASKVIETLTDRGVGARPTWQPLNRQKAFAGAMSLPTPVADALYDSSLCLPCSTGLSDTDLDTVAAEVEAVLGA